MCAFSILDKHRHLLLRLDLPRAEVWSVDEVVRRWSLPCPPKERYGKAVLVTAAWLATMLVSAQAGATCPPTAQALTEPEVRQGLRDAQDRGLLWRLEKGGRISWLYGTLHVARQAWINSGKL